MPDVHHDRPLRLKRFFEVIDARFTVGFEPYVDTPVVPCTNFGDSWVIGSLEPGEKTVRVVTLGDGRINMENDGIDFCRCGRRLGRRGRRLGRFFGLVSRLVDVGYTDRPRLMPRMTPDLAP